jgi:uncharacterized cofD-like protein
MKRIVTIGGGTGTFTVLTGLREYPDVELSAIVTMADNGGSTGRLRDEYGVLPPGDLRQCLIALSEAPAALRQLFNFRYDRGGLKGHTFGNIFISTFEQLTGSLDRALALAGDILKIRGTVIPVTLSSTELIATLCNGKKLRGQHAFDEYKRVNAVGLRNLTLSPKPRANPNALKAIREADLIVVGPGNFYSSLATNFLVPEIGSAVRRAKAKKVLVVNLMNKRGKTNDFAVETYVSELEKLAGTKLFDVVLYNTTRPAEKLLKAYYEEGVPVETKETTYEGRPLVGRDMLATGLYKPPKGDPLRRTLIRHNPHKLARELYKLLP